MILEAIKIKYSTASTAFPPATKQCSKPHSRFKLLKIEFSISQRALITIIVMVFARTIALILRLLQWLIQMELQARASFGRGK